MTPREKFLNYRLFPERFAVEVLGFTPDSVQGRVLDPAIARGILNCSRQWGKSTIVAVKAVHHALFRPGSLTVIAAPSGRQSGELFAKARDFLLDMGIRLRNDGRNRESVVLPNRSRIVAIPAVERTTRGFSKVSLLLIDEASRVDDELYLALRPMIATAENPILWLLSTPHGQQGFFYREWSNPARKWARISVTAYDCPRIPRSYLDDEREALGDDMFRQEYLCEFTKSDHLLYNPADIRAAFRDEIPWLFANAPEPAGPRIVQDSFVIGVDLGQTRDFTTIAIVERRVTADGRIDPVTWEPILDTRIFVRHIERIPLNTSYVDVAGRIRDYANKPELVNRTTLILDATGVGKPIYDFLCARPLPAVLVPATITAGTRITSIGRQQNIPRADLLNGLEGMLRRAELGITPHAPGSAALREELATFSLRKESRDDLIFALALAAWRILNEPPPFNGTNPLPGIVPMFVR